MAYHGDISSQQTLYVTFTTNAAGVPTTLAGTPVLSIYKDDSTAETTTGITLVVDLDELDGFNSVKIQTTDAFYAVGHDYSVVITTGTVGGVRAVGYVVGSFSIENRSALRLNSAIPDSYAAHEAQPTMSQAVLEILQFLTEKSVSSTTVSVKKPDGSTAVMEFTLDSATAPTSITRKANP
jgi:hypothetical protein